MLEIISNRSLVNPGVESVIAFLEPANRLNREDFPTLGLPMRAIVNTESFLCNDVKLN
jgi:hypothetical protein